MIKRPIVRQYQSKPNSCVSACIAMLANVPEAEVTARFNNLYHRDPVITLFTMFDVYDIVAVPCPINTTMYRGEVYLVNVRSLNMDNTRHQVIVECLTGYPVRILDPNAEVEGKRSYPEFPLNSDFDWSADFRILECPAWQRT